MLETRVFTVSSTIVIIKKTLDCNIFVYNIAEAKKIIPDRKFDVVTDNVWTNAYGAEYVNVMFDGFPSPYFINKDSIPKISRKFIKPHAELKEFSSVEEVNKFLKEHSELTLEKVKIIPNSTGILLAYEIKGDKGIDWIG